MILVDENVAFKTILTKEKMLTRGFALLYIRNSNADVYLEKKHFCIY